MIDQRDRSPIPFGSANTECQRLGGRLPSLDEMVRIIQQGAPNGSTSLLWTSSPASNNGTVAIALVAWSGAGQATFDWVGPSDTFASIAFRPFRCVFSEEL